MIEIIIIIILLLFSLAIYFSFGSSSISTENFVSSVIDKKHREKFEQKISYPTDYPSYDQYPVKYPYYPLESYLRYWTYPLGNYPAQPYFYASNEFPMPPCGGWQKKN